MKRISDEFTHMKVSRQRKWQLRKQRDRKCVECGDPVESGCLCTAHKIKYRELGRKKAGSVKRYLNCPSYKEERAK